MSITVTINTKEQITLNNEVVEHLGLRARDQVNIELLGLERISLSRPRTGAIEDVFGILPNNCVSLSIDQMNEAIAAGWSRE